MHLAPYAMTYELAYDSIAMRLAKCLYCKSDITDALTLLGACYAFIESLLRNIKQLSNFFRNLTYTECVARISVETIQERSAVH